MTVERSNAIGMPVKITFAWWFRPYCALTRFGVWLGLPLDHDKVAADFRAAIRVNGKKVKCEVAEKQDG